MWGKENMSIKLFIKKFILRLRGETSVESLISRGLIIGKDCWFGDHVSFDWSFPYLIEIGNNVTVSHCVDFIAHDASLQKTLHVTKLGRIKVEDNVFIGARSIILPNVSIGENAVIAAGSVVNKSIPAYEVWGGTPAQYLCSVKELIDKNTIDKDQILDHTFIATVDTQKHIKVLKQIEENGKCYIC